MLFRSKDSYLTAVTKLDEELVEIIDVEKIMSEVTNASTRSEERRVGKECRSRWER